MRKNKFFRQAVGLCLAGAILCVSTFSVSAETDDSALLPGEITPTLAEVNMADMPSSQLSDNIAYSFDELTLNNLPEYIIDNTLDKDTVPVSLYEANMDDLYTFTTVNEDGTHTLYMFSDPVKYVDKTDNSIKFIDNSIVEAETANGTVTLQAEDTAAVTPITPVVPENGYVNAANFFEVYMPENICMGVSLSVDDMAVTLAPSIPTLSTAILKNSSFLGVNEKVVEYRNVFGTGIHLQYVPINSGFKENIVIDEYTGTNKFIFSLSTSDCYPLYTEGEAIPFADPSTDSIVFILGQVDARDSYTGEETDGHFTLYNSLSLEKVKDGLYTLTVTVDEEFLSDPDTVYPVVIDPSVTVASGNMQDTTVYSGNPDKQAYYSSAYNVVGYHGSSGKEATAFIKMTNMSSYTYIFPGNITSAYYKVYEGSGKTNSMTVQVCTPSATWSQSTITYNNKPVLGTSSSLTVSKSGWHQFDLIKFVPLWLKYVRNEGGRSQDYGFALRSSATNVSSKHFCSANYSGTLTPSIIINYEPVEIFDVNSTYNSANDAPFTGFGYLIEGYAPLFKFKFAYSGEYTFQTGGSTYFAEHGNIHDTKLILYNSSFQQYEFNDNISDINTFSEITINLDAGTYYLGVYSTESDPTSLACYLIAERSGFLRASLEQYADLTYDFYQIDNGSSEENCLNYAIGESDSSLGWLTIDEAKSTFARYSWEYSEVMTDNCVVCYGSEFVYNHFAKIENGVVSAKLGGYDIVRHSKVDAYFDYSCDQIVAYYVKTEG